MEIFNPDYAVEFRTESRQAHKDWCLDDIIKVLLRRSRTIFAAGLYTFGLRPMVRIKMGGRQINIIISPAGSDAGASAGI